MTSFISSTISFLSSSDSCVSSNDSKVVVISETLPDAKAASSSSLKLSEIPDALSEIILVILLPSIPISRLPRLPVESSISDTFLSPPEF